MGITVTLSQMREDIRDDYDIDSDVARLPKNLLNRYINRSLVSLHGLLMELHSEDYYTTETTVSTSANVDNVTLPTGFYKLRKIAYEKNNESYPMRRASHELWKDDITPEPWGYYTPRYRIIKNKLYFWPAPTAVETIRLWYIKGPTILSDDGDTINILPHWLEWIYSDVCIKLANRDKNDPRSWVLARGYCEDKIRESAMNRDENDPPRIRNVKSVDGFDNINEYFDWLTTYG